jgi:5-methylcytosine-specific restriction endonuclease McrA
MIKTCTRCGNAQNTSEFHKDSAAKDGLKNRCKSCVKIYDDLKKDARNFRAREIYRDNPEDKKLKTRQYHLDNPEWSKEKLREHHVKNRVVRYQRVKDRLATDPSFVVYRNNLTRVSELKRRAIKTNTQVENITSLELNCIFDTYEGCCWICDKVLDDTFHWDHVKPLSKGGTHTLDNLRPACATCNVRKSNTWPFTKIGGDAK